MFAEDIPEGYTKRSFEFDIFEAYLVLKELSYGLIFCGSKEGVIDIIIDGIIAKEISNTEKIATFRLTNDSRRLFLRLMREKLLKAASARYMASL